MNKKAIITILLAFVSMTVSAIDDYLFHSGTAVLKGRIQNKAEGEWSIVSVVTFNLFSDEEQVHAIPVAPDGSFEGSIPLQHSHSVYVEDIGYMFLAVGDTLEVIKDATQEDKVGVTFGGQGMSTDVNRLWQGVKKHYFGEKDLLVKGLAREKIPAWKQQIVKLLDNVIADIEADRLPVPAATADNVKEVLGASLLGDLLMATMENYRYNMTTGGFYQIQRDELGDYYDFLAGRERC